MSLPLADIELIRSAVVPLLSIRAKVVSLGVPGIAGSDFKSFFCRELGFTWAQSIDAVDWEGCDTIHDLNEPIGCDLENTADLIIDPGTIEHVFDSKTAMESCHRMLKPGGVIFHHSPLNWVDHGFVNQCPAFFQDCYRANGYTDIQTWHRSSGESEYRRWNYKPMVTRILEKKRYLMASIAKKGKNTQFVVPQQARYTEGVWKNGKKTR